MTIVEAIIEVMNDFPDGMTDKEVYSAIVSKELYKFGALDPVSAVRAKLRSHCVGLDFPSASNRKYFLVVKTVNNTKSLTFIPMEICGWVLWIWAPIRNIR